jgi:hypothetical protein
VFSLYRLFSLSRECVLSLENMYAHIKYAKRCQISSRKTRTHCCGEKGREGWRGGGVGAEEEEEKEEEAGGGGGRRGIFSCSMIL